MRTAILLLTRDLRMGDNPALSAAALEAEAVVPLFVFDREILGTTPAPGRVSFLLGALEDLDASLDARGSGLVVRRGDVVDETVRVASAAQADAVFVAEDVSSYARRREERLRAALAASRRELRTSPGVTVVPPGDLVPVGGGDAYRVFSPYWARWRVAERRAALEPPARLRSIPAIQRGRLPRLDQLVTGPTPTDLPAAGEREGRARLARWLENGIARYRLKNDLLAGVTSGLSPYLHFGCLSPLEVADEALRHPDGEAFARQLCWRDFHHQLHAADPDLARHDLRPRGDSWRDDDEGVERWKAGLTGYPLVDAAMRQLMAEGTMHNRARLVTASFLTKHLYVDWRVGAKHFADHLVDGDVANNVGNWQWVAGTGADTRPNRVLNPLRQAYRLDPEGDYVRRWVHELSAIDGPGVHEPWRLSAAVRGYPPPIVEHEAAVARFRAARGISID